VSDVLVIGAGVAGLACARALRESGAVVTVVDKGRGVGGRCATRRIEGQAVDHGVAFLHGRDYAFLAALDAVDARRLDGWPYRVQGRGTPCHAGAFEPASRRVAFAEGINAFPKSLARGLDVRQSVRVERLTVADGRVVAHVEGGSTLSCATAVLALPAEQAATLLAGVPGMEGARGLLTAVVTHPCWTVMARYDGPDHALEAEIFYPAEGALQLAVHDSSKRVGARVRTLVLQARPSWSAQNIERTPEEIVAQLTEEASARIGGWAKTPTLAIAHRWRYARMDRGTGLMAPFLAALPGGARIGIAGEGFDPVGGVEAAFRSGGRLAGRIATGGVG